MTTLERLRIDHARALLDFETRNRAYFAASIPDRGDDYFTDFTAIHSERVAEQETGTIHMHLVVEADGTILGRVNLVDVADGAAELGYRIAQSAAGKGLATWAVRQVCELATAEYGLKRLRAMTTVDNAASHVVLTRTGFTVTGDTTLNGKPGRHYECDLIAGAHSAAST
ncbi:MAG: GNAT family N-acetyltransferase [Stackebrandtia sp.]